MSSSWLPEDLLLDLLAMLPVKSLLRFRCVSKPWTALIDSQEFIKLHLKQSIMNPKAHQFLSRVPPFGQEHPAEIKSYNLYAAEFDSPENLIETWQEISHPFLKFENIRLVGSCNGLLCIQLSLGSLLLYNPWTKKDWKVPYQAMAKGQRKYGFGYDDTNDDYKVVSIFKCHEVQVYSLKLNSWRRVHDLPYGISCLWDYKVVGVLANCSLHWPSYRTSAVKDESNPDGSIVAIDLRSEKYHLVPLPKFTKRQDVGCLGVLNGCLSLVTGVSHHNFIMWVMKDYGIKDSWTKLTVVQPQSTYLILFPMLQPIAYSETRKQLIFHYPGGFLWFNIETKLFERFHIDKLSVSINVFCCLESLVQPCGGGS